MGCPEASGALWARGQGNACGVAWEWTRAPGRGAGGGPRQGMGSGFFRGIQPDCALRFSLPGLPANHCWAFQRFRAVPHGTSLPRLRRCPALRLGVMARGGGDSECLWESGVLRACGHGSAYGAAWEWAGVTAGERAYGPRPGMGSGFSGEFNQTEPCGVSLLGLPADLCRAFQRFPALPHGTSMPRPSALSCASARGR